MDIKAYHGITKIRKLNAVTVIHALFATKRFITNVVITMFKVISVFDVAKKASIMIGMKSLENARNAMLANMIGF